MDVDAVLDRRRLKRRLTIWRIAALLLIGVLVIAVLSSGRSGSGPYIARLSVSGVIVDDYAREKLMNRMADNDNIKAVIVRINSPGGTVVGSEVLYQGLRKIGAKKPVVAVMSTVGASGGYITALGADRIYARENTLTGSIGVIFQAPEMSELLSNIGVKFNEVKTSPLKGGPSLYSPMTDEQRAAVEVTVADAFDWFVNIVAERRGYTAEELALVADGRVYSGRQAMDNRLIDALGGETDALEWLYEEKDLAKTLPIRDTKSQENFPFLNGVMAWATGDAHFADRLSLDGLLALWHP